MLIVNIAIILLIITLMVGLPLIGIHLEKKGYNNGRCPKCGKSLYHFDTDSQGGRGYCCPDGDYYTWVSYRIVDKNHKEVNTCKHNTLFSYVDAETHQTKWRCANCLDEFYRDSKSFDNGK